jgi:PAS domain S-box-containing protein
MDISEIDLERRRQVLLLKNLYRSFVDNSLELIFRSSSEDQILFCNKLFVERFGFESYLHVKRFFMHQLFSSVDEYVLLKNQLLHGDKVVRKNVHLKDLSGNLVVVLLNAYKQESDDGEVTFNWMALDISDRLEVEQNLEQKNVQLAKINNQMEKFLYSTSHDLRAPLTTILGLLNLVRLDSQDKTVMDYMAKIESSVMRLDKIIRDIINFSKTTYRNIHSERIDFSTLIGRVINASRIEENFNRLKIDIKITGSSNFYSDRDRVEIILSNVIGNAIKFMDETKVFPFIHIKVSLMNDCCLIDVHDNGIGISKRYVNDIFTMFFKASLQGSGAGLGLYITKESVAQLGGKISVESEIGFGSLFRIEIPNSAKGLLINRKESLKLIEHERLRNTTESIT